ncbi:MAG: hypothetical protein AUJ96_24820 [Armatimonadetes bacterium CG2_30_66_41]|nr:MAG: hypothetical protein AUJ96_24820 [Armatimonadetes bacterium CG2_30_66_41]
MQVRWRFTSISSGCFANISSPDAFPNGTQWNRSSAPYSATPFARDCFPTSRNCSSVQTGWADANSSTCVGNAARPSSKTDTMSALGGTWAFRQASACSGLSLHTAPNSKA